MSPTLERLDVQDKPKLGGGGPGKIPYRRGYGGGDDGDHGLPDDSFSRSERLRRFRIGIAAGIFSVGVLFVGLSTVYIWRQGTSGWDTEAHAPTHLWHPLALPTRLLLINSLVLAVSSITLELARRGLLRRSEFAGLGLCLPRRQTELPWLGATVLLGFGFLAGQFHVWTELRRQGIYLATYPSSSFFYLLTGLHAVHLLGGLTALICLFAGSCLRMKLDTQRIGVDVTGWYWHFMGVLWIYVFALLHFARGG